MTTITSTNTTVQPRFDEAGFDEAQFGPIPDSVRLSAELVARLDVSRDRASESSAVSFSMGDCGDGEDRVLVGCVLG